MRDIAILFKALVIRPKFQTRLSDMSNFSGSSGDGDMWFQWKFTSGNSGDALWESAEWCMELFPVWSNANTN